jgi:hypothetical protein
MTDAEIFDIETSYTGGRWAYEHLPEQIREAYVEVAERAVDLIDSARRALPQLPPIHFDFIHDGKVNALAFKAKDRYFIGVTTGTLYMLRMVIGRMLSDPRTFVFVGQPNSEDADLPPVSNYIPDADAMADQEKAVLTPNDKARASFAWYLADQAIMFLVGHEIAHITRGHVDYLATKGGVGFKAQLEWLRKNGSAATLERQCLEMDADRRSILSRIDSLRLAHSNPVRLRPPWSPDSYEVGPIIRDWSASLNLLFRLFGDVRFSLSELNQLMYPPLPVRRALCDIWALGITQEIWDPTLKEVVAEGLLHGRSYVEYAFADILDEQVSTEGLKTAMGKMGQDHMLKLVDHWNTNLVQSVKPFSYEF